MRSTDLIGWGLAAVNLAFGAATGSLFSLLVGAFLVATMLMT